MDPIYNEIHVKDRIASLAREARAERLAARGRRSHESEHDRHPNLRHEHGAGGFRAALGRLLIGLGTAIAGEARQTA